jgi:protein-S-isoprenylcysteine O-methyltransferase Ste14
MAGPAEDRGPGVVVLPPVLFALTLLAGTVLSWASPLPFWDARWPRRVAGAALFAVGLAFALWGERAMHRAGTNLRADRPSTAIVDDGPFRYTRNPLYLSVTTMFLGVAFLANSAWLLLLLVPMALVLHFGIVRREERYLEAKFGEPYRAYRARVRRYF